LILFGFCVYGSVCVVVFFFFGGGRTWLDFFLSLIRVDAAVSGPRRLEFRQPLIVID